MRFIATPIYYAFFISMGAGYTTAASLLLAMCFPDTFCNTGRDAKPAPDHWFCDWAPWIGCVVGWTIAWLLPRVFARRTLDAHARRPATLR